MGAVVDGAVALLNSKVRPGAFDGTARFVLTGEGSVVLDAAGARAGGEADGPADVTLTADPDTFRAMLEGALDPTSAFMSGRLGVDGDMGAAMRLGSLLA